MARRKESGRISLAAISSCKAGFNEQMLLQSEFVDLSTFSIFT